MREKREYKAYRLPLGNPYAFAQRLKNVSGDNPLEIIEENEVYTLLIHGRELGVMAQALDLGLNGDITKREVVVGVPLDEPTEELVRLIQSARLSITTLERTFEYSSLIR